MIEFDYLPNVVNIYTDFKKLVLHFISTKSHDEISICNIKIRPRKSVMVPILNSLPFPIDASCAQYSPSCF